VHVTIFVPAHRCGAVPDSHRVPFSAPAGPAPVHQQRHAMYRHRWTGSTT